MELAQLAVFVRSPIPGQVKTRLSKVFGDHGAAALYRAFVEDTLRLCARVRAAGHIDVTLWSTDPVDDTVVAWAGRFGTVPQRQPDGDLGTKLSAAFDAGHRRYERVVIIGSDAPTLPIDLIGAAFGSLEKAPIVLGPANDGGYYAIGASHRTPPSFAGVRWSTVIALNDTVMANVHRGVAMISPWYDIDEPEDLPVLRAHLSVDPSAAVYTARRLEALRKA